MPARRLALFLEESIDRGTRWAVFEPNNEPLRAQLREQVGDFLHDLFLAGAYQGITPGDVFFVKCDRDTTTRADIDAGRLNIVTLKPVVFVFIRISQLMRECD